MGLLDLLNSRGGIMGAALLEASRPQAVRPSLGGGLLAALNAGQAWDDRERGLRERAEDRAMRQQQFDLQRQQQQYEFAQAQQQAAAQQAAAARLGSFRQDLQPGAVTPQQALFGGGGPTQANAAQIGQARGPDWQALALKYPEQVETLQKLSAASNWGRNKVARTVKGMGPDGREYEYQVDEYGQRVGDGLAQYRAPLQVGQGDRTTFRDAYDPNKIVGTAQMFQSPDSRAASAQAWARLAFDKQKDASDQAGAGQLVETDNGYVRVGRDNRVTPVFAPGGGLQPLRGKGSMTEDQSKATGWLVQAENAFKNMQSASRSTPGAAFPGLNDALAAIPSMGLGNAVANSMRGNDRQKFLQGASSLSEALLRAATGAGVNESEALQKVRELTPQFGDGEAVVRQKMESIPLYIESLRVRAGQGAAKAAGIAAPSELRIVDFGDLK